MVVLPPPPRPIRLNSRVCRSGSIFSDPDGGGGGGRDRRMRMKRGARVDVVNYSDQILPPPFWLEEDEGGAEQEGWRLLQRASPFPATKQELSPFFLLLLPS